MKKLINPPTHYVEKMLAGLLLVNPSLQRDGGSGRLPPFTGYVGAGLFDTCSIGNVFEGPNGHSDDDSL